MTLDHHCFDFNVADKVLVLGVEEVLPLPFCG